MTITQAEMVRRVEEDAKIIENIVDERGITCECGYPETCVQVLITNLVKGIATPLQQKQAGFMLFERMLKEKLGELGAGAELLLTILRGR